MPMSKAHIKASRKYNEKAYDRLTISVKKGQKDIIKSAANSVNESVNSYIVKAIEQRIESDN